MRKSSYTYSAYGKMRDRQKAKEAEKKKAKSKVPYKYLLFMCEE